MSKHSAMAKALLQRRAMIHAGRLGVGATAQAVLAQLIAESWPENGGWVARVSHRTIANRIGRSIRTVRRSLASLAELVHYQPGDGLQESTHTIVLNDELGSRVSKTEGVDKIGTVSGKGGHWCPGGGDTGDPPSSVLSVPSMNNNSSSKTVLAASAKPAAAAVEARHFNVKAAPLPQDQSAWAKRYRWWKRRPAWLREDCGWLDHQAITELASSPITHQEAQSIMYAASASWKTLSNPAGYVRNEVRRVVIGRKPWTPDHG